uniref:Uncharacterized protein n=1 Tax=Anguilla anguilla TaxID=7936 RepID=A0A0E9S9U4_ANGAN
MQLDHLGMAGPIDTNECAFERLLSRLICSVI